MATSNDIRRKITEQIIDALNNGGLPPWRMPWNVHPNGRGLPVNVDSQKPYSGLNPLLLTLHQRRLGLTSKWYGTFRQWKSLGCSVKARPTAVEPGAWGATVIYFQPLKKKEIDKKTGEEREVQIPLLKSYSVFNSDQVEGADQWQVPESPATIPIPSYEPAETAIEATGADIRFGSNRAFYSPAQDFIQCPNKGQFIDVKEYYSTVLHELGHWSESRLDWKAEYAFSELRAEITSAYLMAELGVPQSEDLTNCNAYLKSWLSALKNDTAYIFKASAAASKATAYILSFSRQSEDQEIPEDNEAIMA